MSLYKSLDELAGRWRRGLWVLPAFCLGSLLVYWPVRNVPFLSDDYFALGNFLVQGFYWTWGEYPGLFFRPLFVLSHWLDLGLWGLHPEPHHIVNMLWHGVNAALVTWFAHFWFKRSAAPASGREFLPAILAGTLFLVLPTHTEAVAYICRSDLLATCFSLLALNAFVRYMDDGWKGHLTLLGCSLAAGLFSKESAISVLPMLGVLGAGFWWTAPDRRQTWSRLARTLAAAVLVTAVFYAIRFAFIRTWVGVYGLQAEWFDPNWWLPNLGRTVWRLFVPVLSFEQAERLRRLPAWLGWGSGLGTAALLAWGMWRPGAARSAVPGWWLAGLALCALVSAYPIILWGIAFDSVEGERWLYLPTVFSCVGLVGLGIRVLPGRRTWLVLMSVLILFYTISLQRTLQYWVSAGEMVRSILRDSVAQVSQERLLVLNLPDKLNGAYVFHIGFIAALRIFEGKRTFGHLERIVRDPGSMADPWLQKAAIAFATAGRSAPGWEKFERAEEVLRQGLLDLGPSALRTRDLLRDLRRITALKRVEVASYHTCRTPRDRVRVSPAPGGVDLHLEAPGTIFIPMHVPDGLSVTLVAPDRAEVRFVNGPPADTDLLYWDEGRLRRWVPALE